MNDLKRDLMFMKMNLISFEYIQSYYDPTIAFSFDYSRLIRETKKEIEKLEFEINKGISQ